MSPARVIGVNGILPWHYPVDLRRFKQRTLGATIIMGRLTWESIGCKKLPKRRNVVITSAQLPHVETFLSIDDALLHCDGQIWFIGGAMLYEAALSYCELSISCTFRIKFSQTAPFIFRNSVQPNGDQGP